MTGSIDIVSCKCFRRWGSTGLGYDGFGTTPLLLRLRCSLMDNLPPIFRVREGFDRETHYSYFVCAGCSDFEQAVVED